MKLTEQISEHSYLYLTEIGEPEDNVLRLVVEQAMPSIEERDLRLGDSVIPGARDIVSDERCFAYEIIFESYIGYTVLNESFSQVDDSEIYTGNRFRIYSKSNFLEYLKLATFASEDFPGEFKHYSLIALNHIVEIASNDAPQIEILRVPIKQNSDFEAKEYEN